MSDSSFVNEFQWAVIRLATLQIRRGEQGRLLFASVTLLSPNRPPPCKMEGIESQKLGKSGMTVFFRQTILKAQDAVDWYRSLEENQRTPIPSREDDIEYDKNGHPIDGGDFFVSNLIDDPIWPHLGYPIGESLLAQSSEKSNPAPFIGNIPARIHRRFGSTEGFEGLVANEKVLSFIARRLHINLKDYPEYLGSVVLVVPDPIINQIDNFLIPATAEHGERIFYRFVARPNQTLNGLKITMFDEQSYLLSSFEVKDIPVDGIIEIDKGNCSGAYGYVVTHATHGILVYHPPSGFLRQVNLSMGIVNQIRKVSVPTGDSPKSPQIEYRVNRTSREQHSVIGDQSPAPNINVRIEVARRQREKAANAARFDQHWFGSDTREEAMAFVRERIARARERIIIADPYFGVLQVPQYLLAITSDTVKIQILTSRLAFESVISPECENKETSSTQKPNLVQKLEHLTIEIDQIKKEGNPNFEVMVLRGKSPTLHDRFLVVDNQVWFLGNSLNTLGDRASMIIKLPNPDEVLNELEIMFKQSDQFEVYRQQRLNALKSDKI